MNIASPKHQKLLSSLDLALVKPEDINLPRLRRHTDTDRSSARKQYRQLRDNRKLTFSSDDEEERDDFDAAMVPDRPEMSLAMSPEPEYSPEPDQHGFGDVQDYSFTAEATPESELVDIKQSTPEHSLAPAKRKRGRPRKAEREKQVKKVTRRSQRIVANPSFGKLDDILLSAPKPLRAIGLVHTPVHVPNAVLLTKSTATGRQKPLTINAERLHTASTRDRRFNLTTLDVLRQFVDEHLPKGMKNDSVNENIVLSEFKAHLLYHIHHLMDLHASVRDISHDIADVQRRKNEMRRSILELRKQHALVGTELNKLRKTYRDDKDRHADFKQMVDSFGVLKDAVTEDDKFKTNLSDKVLLRLGDVSKVFHPTHGLRAQLLEVNSELSAMVEQ